MRRVRVEEQREEPAADADLVEASNNRVQLLACLCWCLLHLRDSRAVRVERLDATDADTYAEAARSPLQLLWTHSLLLARPGKLYRLRVRRQGGRENASPG